jgi:hypothetical protein
MDKINSSLLIKIYAVDCTERSHGKLIPGIDGKRFLKELKVSNIKNLMEILPAKKLASLVKGSISQAKQRKGELNLVNEKTRDALKSTELGYKLKRLAREELKLICENPFEYIKGYNEVILKSNIKLKQELLEALKPMRLLKYESDRVLRVMKSMSKGKMLPLWVPTIKDRLIQRWMLLNMEPYMEPLGDRSS